MNADEIVVNLIRLNGRQIDCERLQWEAYLLHRCGADFDVKFIYHHGGPYSHDLASGWESARCDKRIAVEEVKTRHGTPYWVSRRSDHDKDGGFIDGLAHDLARRRLEKMAAASDLVLELASAFVFLQKEGEYDANAIEELKIRKPLTTRNEQLVDQALRLLSDLGLETSKA